MPECKITWMLTTEWPQESTLVGSAGTSVAPEIQLSTWLLSSSQILFFIAPPPATCFLSFL